jgi:tRNA1(Val) A37 N6-methylase TrmN6
MDAGEAAEDLFLDGRVRVVQPRAGYRAGLDAVLLAAALEAKPGARLFEAGCGAGAALLCAAWRLDGAAFTGMERDPAMAALAREGAARNGWWERIAVVEGDATDRAGLVENGFDQAFSNPPWYEPGRMRAPAPGRARAFLAEDGLDAWVLALLHATRPGGRVTLIHRAAALANLLAALDRRAGEIEVMPVRPAPGLPARRLLVRARKGLRRGEVTLYDGLALHETPGGPLTPRAAATLEGAKLDWR